MHIGFRTNRNLPKVPMYLDLQPADHNRIMYSTPKNTTRQISCRHTIRGEPLMAKINVRWCRTTPLFAGWGWVFGGNVANGPVTTSDGRGVFATRLPKRRRLLVHGPLTVVVHGTVISLLEVRTPRENPLR